MTLALTGKTRKRKGGLLAAAVLAVMVAAVGALLLVGGASAHANVISGVATCQTDGTYTIVWTIKNDWTVPETVSNVKVSGIATDWSSSVSPNPIPASPAGSYPDHPELYSFATLTTPGIRGTVTLETLSTHGLWTDSFTSDDSGGATGLTGNCTPAPLPTVSKAATETSASGGLGHWDITIDNTATGSIDRNLSITDTGATLASITGGTGDTCGTTPNITGSFSCTVKAGHTLTLHLTKPVNAATNANNTCQDGTLDNSTGVTAQLVGAASITVSFGTTVISVPGTASQNCLTVQKTSVDATHYTLTFTNTGPATTFDFTDTFTQNATTQLISSLTFNSPLTAGTCGSLSLPVASVTCTGNGIPDGRTTPQTGTVTVTMTAYTNAESCSDQQVSNTVSATWNNAAGAPQTIPTAPNGQLTATNTFSTTRTDCNNGFLVITKVVDTSAGVPSADNSVFSGTIDTSGTWGPIGFGNNTGQISVAPGSHTVTETGTQNGWTPVGWAFEGDGCPTDKASYTGASISATVSTGATTYLCVMNTKSPEVVVPPPTAVKTADNPAVSGGRLHWAIEINNSAQNAADQTVVVTDAGVSLDSVTPVADATDCSGTGPFACAVPAGHDIFLHVSKPIPTMTTQQQCQGEQFSNTASATYGSGELAPVDLPVDTTNTTINVPANTAECPGPTLSKTAVGFNSAGGTATWTIGVSNNAAGAIDQTVLITDAGATIAGAAPAACSGVLATGLSCNVGAGTVMNLTVQVTGLSTTCQGGSVSNSATATIDGVSIAGSPTGAVSVSIPANTSLCPTPTQPPQVCTIGCFTIVTPTPSPSPTPVTPSPTPVTPTTVPTQAAPATPSPSPINVVLGARSTPAPPSTGTGTASGGSNAWNLFLAGLGALAVAGGLVLIAMRRDGER